MKRNTDQDAPACCASPTDAGTGAESALPEQGGSEAFAEYMAAVTSPGAIGVKNKKLMALALSVSTKCGPCIKINVQGARRAGASEKEISEAAALGIAFGGASAAMFYRETRGGI